MIETEGAAAAAAPSVLLPLATRSSPAAASITGLFSRFHGLFPSHRLFLLHGLEG